MDNVSRPFSAPNEDDQLDLKKYWSVVTRYKWGIAGLVFALTMAAMFVVFSLQPVYRATVTLLIEQKQNKVVGDIGDWSGTDIASKEYLQTQFEIIKSRDLAERIVRELDLANHSEFMADPTAQKSWITEYLDWRSLLPQGHKQNPIATDDEKFNRLVDKFMTQLSIEPVRNTQLVKISFEAKDRKLTAAVANAMAKGYITGQMEVRVNLTEQAAEWLTSRLGVLKANLEAAAKRLQDYREANSLIETGQNGGVFAIAAGQVDDINKRLVEGQFKATEISKRYGSKHPLYIQAYMEVAEAERALAEAKSSAMDVGKKQFRLQELQREVETNRALYDAFFQRIKEANESLQLETSNARVVDKAIAPAIPVKPRKGLIVGIVLILSTILAVGLAFLLDYLDATLKSPEDVEQKLGISMLGMVPFVAERKGRKAKDAKKHAVLFLDPKEHGYAEAIRTVRTSVVLSGIDKPHRIILLTSSVPSEGKTTTSLNLAVSLAQMEKVLLIDADMRRPSIGKTLGIPMNSPGLANVVSGTAELDDCLMHMEEENIDVLTAGLIPPNPLELLSSHRFAEVVRGLLSKYDRIVIDSPPTLLVSDSLVLSKVVDAVLYVVRSDTTNHGTARGGIARLKSANAPLIGVVLNKVNMKRAAKYYGAYSGYYNYGYHTYGYTHKVDDRA